MIGGALCHECGNRIDSDAAGRSCACGRAVHGTCFHRHRPRPPLAPGAAAAAGAAGGDPGGDLDFTVAASVARASGVRQSTPRHMRVAGIAFLLTSATFVGFTYDHVRWGHYYYPKAVALALYAFLYGLWLLLDAGALAAGRRRYQKAFLVMGGLFAVAMSFAFPHLLR